MEHFPPLLLFGGGRGLRTALKSSVGVKSVRCFLPDGLVEDALQVSLRQGRAFEVLLGPDLPARGQALFVLHGRGAHLAHALLGCLVIPQIEFGANKDDGDAWGVVLDFWGPLLLLAAVGAWFCCIPWP
jgi:hypothetical protein